MSKKKEVMPVTHLRRRVSKTELLRSRKRWLAALPAEDADFSAQRVHLEAKKAFIEVDGVDEQTAERLAKKYCDQMKAANAGLRAQRRFVEALIKEVS